MLRACRVNTTIQLVTNAYPRRVEAAHSWEDERDRRANEQGTPRYGKVQSCPAERPVQPGEVQEDGCHDTTGPKGTFQIMKEYKEII